MPDAKSSNPDKQKYLAYFIWVVAIAFAAFSGIGYSSYLGVLDDLKYFGVPLSTIESTELGSDLNNLLFGIAESLFISVLLLVFGLLVFQKKHWVWFAWLPFIFLLVVYYLISFVYAFMPNQAYVGLGITRLVLVGLLAAESLRAHRRLLNESH